MTASRSNKSCAESIGIVDREIAFAFDMECNEILTEWEMEQHAKQAEAVAVASIAQVFGRGPSGPVDGSGPVILDA